MIKQENPIKELRRLREKIFAECGFDVNRLFDRYRRSEERLQDRLVELPHVQVRQKTAGKKAVAI